MTARGRRTGGETIAETQDCGHAQEVLSAAADGEVAGFDDLVIARARRHATTCGTCGAFVAALPSSRPDSHPTAVGIEFPPMAPGLKWWLIAVGTVELALGIPLLLGWNSMPVDGADLVHLVRDGVGSVLLGAALLVAALRPRLARQALMVGALVLAVQVVGSAVDLLTGRVDAAFELTHVVSVFGVLLLWLADRATAPRRRRPANRASRTSP